MANPYSAPTSDVGQRGAYQPFDFETTFAQAWTALKASLWTLVAATLILGIAMTGSLVLIVVGWVCLLPAIMWGGAQFFLNTLDGRAELGDLWVGFQENYIYRSGQMLLLIVIFIALGFLSQAVYFLGVALEDEILIIIGFVVQMVVQYAVLNRFYLTPFFLVDKGMSAIEAFSASWRSTSQQWLLFIAIAFIVALVQGLGVLLCCVGVLASVPYGYLMFASVYRQVTGTSRAPKVRRRRSEPS